MSDNHNKSLEILKSCLNKEIEEICITGWSEIKDNFNVFYPMLWWYYIKFEDFFLCIASSTTSGMIQFFTHQEIQCNFDIEEEDVFTISSVCEKDYSGQKIVSYDLIYGNFSPELCAFGVQFEDNKYLTKNRKYVFFNSVSLNGIIFGDKRDKDLLLEDNRFHLIKLD